MRGCFGNAIDKVYNHSHVVGLDEMRVIQVAIAGVNTQWDIGRDMSYHALDTTQEAIVYWRKVWLKEFITQSTSRIL
jgi:hypothetical protein